MKTEMKVLIGGLTISFSTMCFFLTAFYNKVDDGLVEIAKINTTLAVAVSEMTGLKNDVAENKADIKKLSNGFINLETRVGYLESNK